MMPLINLRTNISDIQDADGFLKRLSSDLAVATSKPETYVMTLLEHGIPMMFASSDEPCAYVEIESIGSITLQSCQPSFLSCSKHHWVCQKIVFVLDLML